MIQFEYPHLLWLLLAVPVWLGLLLYGVRRRRDAAAQFVELPLLERIVRGFHPAKLRAKAYLWSMAWLLLVIGAANPQVGTRMEEVKRQGIDVIIAVDVSTSMTCEDLKPSRLENAKHELFEFVSGLRGDRVGLIAFAGTPIVHCPLTTDYGAVKLLIKVLEPGLVPEAGTALADAIDAARKSFNLPDSKSKLLVIISDGEDHEAQAIDAARDGAKDDIRIYTIGLGTPGGAPIPAKDDRGRDIGWKRDKQGNVVVTRLNEVLLQQIAEAGGGKYLRATQNARELEAIWADIETMEKQEFGKKQFAGFEDRFQYAIFPALLLLLGEFLVAERRIVRRWPRIARVIGRGEDRP